MQASRASRLAWISLINRRRMLTEFPTPLPDIARNARAQLRPTMVTLANKMVNAIRNAVQMCIPEAGWRSQARCLQWCATAGYDRCGGSERKRASHACMGGPDDGRPVLQCQAQPGCLASSDTKNPSVCVRRGVISSPSGERWTASRNAAARSPSTSATCSGCSAVKCGCRPRNART